MKKSALLFLLAALVIALGGCGKTKVLHCDYCNAEVTVKESSNMEEDWIIYCAPCNEELFGDHPLLGNG